MKEKCAIVTGAQGDIATEIIAYLLNNNIKVYGITTHDVPENYIEKIKKNLNEESIDNIGKLTVFKMESLEDLEIKKIIEKISYENVITKLVITHAKSDNKILLDCADAYVQEVIDVNLKSYISFTKNVISAMLKEDINIKKDIIMITSIWGLKGAANESIYSMTKGGVEAFAKSVAKEYSKMNIMVNTIAPGYIDTKMNKYSKEIVDEIIEEIPLGRIGKTKDIIPAIKYIFESEYTTGETIKVTGGWYN